MKPIWDLLRQKWWKDITVEPGVAFYFTCDFMMSVFLTNLYLQKMCRDSDVEPDLRTDCENEKRGIDFVAQIGSWSPLLNIVFMTLLTSFGTSWSDKVGRRRRPLLVIPMIGQILQILNCCLHSYFWTWPPMWAVCTNLFFHGFLGGPLCVQYSMIIYISDITSEMNRTSRIGMLTAVRLVCIPVGNCMAGYMLRPFGFFYSFLCCMSLSVLGLVFTMLLVKSRTGTKEEKSSLTFMQTINPGFIVESCKVIFKKRPDNKRTILILLLITDIIVDFATIGEFSVLYLYLRSRFGWNERQFSVYFTYKLIGLLIGTIFSSILLSKILKLHDSLIGTFAGFWDALAAFFYIFADNELKLYLIPLLDIFQGVAIAVARSHESKIIDSTELGHFTSVRALLDIVIHLCYPAYNLLFLSTKDSFPSAFFVLSVFLDIPVCLLYGLIYFLSRRYYKSSQQS